MRIAGHLQEYRALGGVAFALVRDRSGLAQVTLKKGSTPPEMFERVAGMPRESVVEVEGTVRASARANLGAELLPTRFDPVTLAEQPLPLGIADRVNVELDTRFNHRVLDLRKPEVRAVFELRSALLAALRSALRERGFLEVETPKILRQGAEGGATLFPVQYFETRAFLAQSPQLYKQMLMSAGFERVFEIAPAFRAEPSDTVRHITEFASFDAEIAYIDSAEDLRALLEELVRASIEGARRSAAETGNPLAAKLPRLEAPFPRITYREARSRLGLAGPEEDFTTEDERRLGELFAAEGHPFYFIIDYASRAKRSTFYAGRKEEDPSLTGYFDLAHRGLELASGGPREHRYERLVENMRLAGLDPAAFAGYLEAFRFGMPRHGGWGFGFDRFVQALAGLPNVREARLFPRDRYRLDP